MRVDKLEEERGHVVQERDQLEKSIQEETDKITEEVEREKREIGLTFNFTFRIR